jgi:hypothetical protein
VSAWHALVSWLAFAGCADSRSNDAPPPLETAIARALTARFGVPVTTRCAIIGGTPIACHASLADGTQLPIAIAGKTWHLAGRVVETAPIAAYVQGVLADLGRSERATCGPAVQRVAPGQRIACALSGGGAAFVEIASNGALAVELALDRAAAAARTSGEPERELLRRSRALDRGDAAEEP